MSQVMALLVGVLGLIVAFGGLGWVMLWFVQWITHH